MKQHVAEIHQLKKPTVAKQSTFATLDSLRWVSEYFLSFVLEESSAQKKTEDPTKTSLPEIDLTEFYLRSQTHDRKIVALFFFVLQQIFPHWVLLFQNDKLQTLSIKVQELGQQAKTLGSQLDHQFCIMDNMEEHTDVLNTRLYAINKKLKQTLETVRGPGRFCLDVCCICIVLAIAGFIFNMVKSQ